MVRNVGRLYEEQLRTETEMSLSMFMRRDSDAIGARAFKENKVPEWPHRGLDSRITRGSAEGWR